MTQTQERVDHSRITTPTWDDIAWEPMFHTDDAALLVIDPQNDILMPEGNMAFRGVYHHAPSTVPHIKTLVAEARTTNMPVFWFRYLRAANGRDVFEGTMSSARIKKFRSLVPGMYDEGTWDADIIDELKELMVDQDYLIDKSAAGCFEGTNLDKYLRGLGIKHLVVTGYLTDFCVANTARQAYDKDYGVILVEDACASYSVANHDSTLSVHRQNFGPVLSTEDTLALLRSRRRER